MLAAFLLEGTALPWVRLSTPQAARRLGFAVRLGVTELRTVPAQLWGACPRAQLDLLEPGRRP